MTMTKDACEAMRRELKDVAERLWAASRGETRGEVIANAMLAFRHLEDASMRLGKAIQAIDGGASVYDAAQVPRSEVP